MNTIDRLDEVLKAAGPAHHTAFLDVDGDDPEWPIWYAGHVLAAVREVLGVPGLTQSRLVAAFVGADQAYTAARPGTPWHRFYAERFAEELGRPDPGSA